jgi:hypothetical protein
MNTTFRIKYPFENNYVYIGFGPKLDYLLSDNKLKSYDYILRKWSLGFKPEIGFTKYLSNSINVGLNYSYLWNIRNVAKTEYTGMNHHHHRILLSIGYVIK